MTNKTMCMTKSKPYVMYFSFLKKKIIKRGMTQPHQPNYTSRACICCFPSHFQHALWQILVHLFCKLKPVQTSQSISDRAVSVKDEVFWSCHLAAVDSWDSILDEDLCQARLLTQCLMCPAFFLEQVPRKRQQISDQCDTHFIRKTNGLFGVYKSHKHCIWRDGEDAKMQLESHPYCSKRMPG